MIDDAELAGLLTDVESDRVERKQSISDKSKILQAICALSNDMPGHGEPGVVFIGAKDDGSCAGLDIDDQLLLTLAGMRSDGNILPLPTMSVQKRTVNGCDLAVIEVQPSRFPPVKYNGRTWIRVGHDGRLPPNRKNRFSLKDDVQGIFPGTCSQWSRPQSATWISINFDATTDRLQSRPILLTRISEPLNNNWRRFDCCRRTCADPQSLVCLQLESLPRTTSPELTYSSCVLTANRCKTQSPTRRICTVR